MAADPLIPGLVGILETVAGSLVAGADAVEGHVDIATASPPLLRYIASWLAADLDPSISVERQRELLLATGPLLGRRGTRRGLETLLAALTGGRARVVDHGGVFTRHESVPPADASVVVELDSLGELTLGQVRALVERELPMGTVLTLAPVASAARGAP